MTNFSSAWKKTTVRLVLLSPMLAFASVFDILYPNDDLSITYLNFLFGPLTNTGLYLAPTALYFLLVKILIFPLLVGSIMLSWHIYMGTLSSAKEGSFLGQKLSQTSVVLRSLLGMALLTPDHTGYAAIQKIMMSIILAGIGLANTVWSMVTDQYAKGMSLMQPIVYDSSDQVYARRMISIAAMLGYLERQYIISGEEITVDTETALYQQLLATPVSPATDPGALNLFFYTGAAGSTIPEAVTEGGSTLLETFIGQPYVQILVEWMINHPDKVINVYRVFADAGISDADLNAWMINCYELTRQQMQIVNEKRNNEITKYLEQGWLVAGSIYWKLSTSSGEGSSYTAILQPAGTTGLPAGSTSSLQSWLVALDSVRFTDNPILSTSIGKIQRQIAKYGASEKNGIPRPENPIDADVSTIDFSFEALDNTFSKAMDGVDPIITFARDCQRMMKNILVFFMSTLLVIAAISFIAVMRYQLPMVQSFCYALGSIMMLMMSFSFIFIPPSAMGGYYLPLIPVLIYSAALVSWFVKVVEAIVAVPFVALALIEPTQDEFGRAKAALILTLHVMLKPVLMVIGLFLGGRMATIALASLTLPLNAYFTYKSFALASSNVVLERVLIYILMNQVVVGIVVALANRAFSLIYKIPDQVFGWIGHRAQPADVAGMVSEAHQGAEQGIQMMNQIFQIGTAVGKVALSALDTMSKTNK